MVLKTVNIAPADVVPDNAARQTISFTNRSAAGQVIYLTKGTSNGLSTSNAEYVLSVGESLHFILAFDGSDICDTWGAMATADGAIMYVGESSKRPEVK
jgi:hypothetical protein